MTELGRAAVRAMVREGVIIDVSHMRADAIAETFAMLNEEDRHGEMPVIASHAGYRFGGRAFLLEENTIREIARRGGVVGLIMAQHQLNDGIRRVRTKTLEQSLEVICRHVDKIRDITGSHDHVAPGSDFDGFIKPTMGGLEHMGHLAGLEQKRPDHVSKRGALAAKAVARRRVAERRDLDRNGRT